jgi:prepilin-type processing-associated H-X9-DG protein
LLSERHNKRSNAAFLDVHAAAINPREAYKDNRLWNGLGFDPGTDPASPDFRLDPHVDYKYDPSSGQVWPYGP